MGGILGRLLINPKQGASTNLSGGCRRENSWDSVRGKGEEGKGYVPLDEAFHFLFFEQNRFSRFKDENGNSGINAGLDGLGTDAGNVETHVVSGLGDFHGDGPALFSGQLAAAGKAAVGAFEAFHREDGAFFHDDG